MKKSGLGMIIVLAVLLTAGITGTIAYFSDQADAENTFAFGSVEGQITEDNWTGSGDDGVYSKDPVVENTGGSDAYVRIRLMQSDSRVAVDYYNDDSVVFAAEDGVINLSDGDTVGDWTYEDGYFYYNEVLAVNENTDALFDSVELTMPASEVDPEINDFQVYVMAEMVQAEDMAITYGSDDVDNAQAAFDCISSN